MASELAKLQVPTPSNLEFVRGSLLPDLMQIWTLSNMFAKFRKLMYFWLIQQRFNEEYELSIENMRFNAQFGKHTADNQILK